MAKTKVKFDLKKALALATKKHLVNAKEKAGSGGFEEFDDGKYIMRCEGGELGQSASSDRFQATMFWKFVEGDYAKKPYRSYQGLDTEDGWTYFIHGWSQAIMEALHIDLSAGEIETLSGIAADLR